MEEVKKFKNFYKANVIEVCEGEGTKESVARIVYYVYDLDGNFIGEIDNYKKKKYGKHK